LNPADILQKIAATLREVEEDVVIPPEAEFRGKHLVEDLNLDSLDVIKFILLVEERFECKLPDADIDRLDLLRVGNLATYLADHVAG